MRQNINYVVFCCVFIWVDVRKDQRTITSCLFCTAKQLFWNQRCMFAGVNFTWALNSECIMKHNSTLSVSSCRANSKSHQLNVGLYESISRRQTGVSPVRLVLVLFFFICDVKTSGFLSQSESVRPSLSVQSWSLCCQSRSQRPFPQTWNRFCSSTRTWNCSEHFDPKEHCLGTETLVLN